MHEICVSFHFSCTLRICNLLKIFANVLTLCLFCEFYLVPNRPRVHRQNDWLLQPQNKRLFFSHFYILSQKKRNADHHFILFFFISFFFRLQPKIESFHKLPMEIDLTQACVGELNTILRGETNWPIIYGVGVNIKTGEIFPASFPDKGPDLQLRQARNFTGGQTVSEK